MVDDSLSGGTDKSHFWLRQYGGRAVSDMYGE